MEAALLLALYVGLAFAIHDAITKTINNPPPVEAMAVGTLVWGLAVIAVVSLILGMNPPSMEATLYYAAAGILNFAVGRSLLYLAIRRLGSSGGSVLSSTSAVFGVVAGWLLASEQLDPWIITGAFLIFTAAYLALGGVGERDLIGFMAGLGNGLGIASGIALARLGNITDGDPMAGVLIAYTTAILFSGAATLRHGAGMVKEVLGSRILILLGLLTASGQVSRYIALTSLGASIVAPLQNTRPLLATIMLAMRGVDETKPGWRHWVASILVIMGVYMVASHA